MATMTQNVGTRVAYPGASNLISQPAAAARTIGVIDSSAVSPANPLGYKIDYTIRAATTGVNTGGSCTFYLIESMDGGTTYTDNMNINTTTDQASSLKNARPVEFVALNTNSQVATATFELPPQFSPSLHTLLLVNSSGAALLSSGQSVSATPIAYNIA